jgi:CheY-like chemotaxis protein
MVGKRILEMFGYANIASAADGQKAVEEAEKQSYDLILLDLQMPVMDGFQAQKRITASPLAGDPCIVALTANADKVSIMIVFLAQSLCWNRLLKGNAEKLDFSVIYRNLLIFQSWRNYSRQCMRRGYHNG